MRPTRGRQDPGGPHVGPMNLAIWVAICGPEQNHYNLYIDRHKYGYVDSSQCIALLVPRPEYSVITRKYHGWWCLRSLSCQIFNTIVLTMRGKRGLPVLTRDFNYLPVPWCREIIVRVNPYCYMFTEILLDNCFKCLGWINPTSD